MDVNRSGFYKWRNRMNNLSSKKLKRNNDIELFRQYYLKYPSHGYRWLNAKIKTIIQKYFIRLSNIIDKLKEYANKIGRCGENRNSYSKTDVDATFMRMKTDYMGKDIQYVQIIKLHLKLFLNPEPGIRLHHINDG